MKQNISPAMIGIIITIVVIGLIVFGVRMFGSGDTGTKLKSDDYKNAPPSAQGKQGAGK